MKKIAILFTVALFAFTATPVFAASSGDLTQEELETELLTIAAATQPADGVKQVEYAKAMTRALSSSANLAEALENGAQVIERKSALNDLSDAGQKVNPVIGASTQEIIQTGQALLGSRL